MNLLTVSRNIASAYNFKDGSDADFEATSVAILDETISTLIQEFSNRSNVKIAFYLVDYTKVNRRGAIRYEPSTDNQKLTRKRETYLLPHLAKYSNITFSKGDVICPSEERGETVFITTHIAQDLLNAHTFRSLTLLESHTGALKNTSEFNTKLNISPEQRRIVPLNKFTLRVFGDGVTYSPQPIKLRKTLLEFFEKFGVNSHTKLERLKFILESKNRMLYMGLRDFFS
jgi:hypothetical protein